MKEANSGTLPPTLCLSACLYGRKHATYLEGLLLLSRSMLLHDAGAVLVVWHDEHVDVSCRSSVCTTACVPVYWKQMPVDLDAEWKMSTRILTLQFAETWGIDHVIMTDLDVCDLRCTVECCDELQRLRHLQMISWYRRIRLVFVTRLQMSKWPLCMTHETPYGFKHDYTLLLFNVNKTRLLKLKFSRRAT